MTGTDYIRIALLTDMVEGIGGSSINNEAVFGYELAAALLASARDVGGISVDIIACKSKENDLPVISIDPTDLGAIPPDPLYRFAYQEAIYNQVFIGGLLNDYALVHCLAPVVTPLLLLAASGIPVVQTVTAPCTHPSAKLLPMLMGNRFRQVSIGPYLVQNEQASIPPSVDMTRFRPVDHPTDGFILYTGEHGQWLAEIRSLAGTHLPVYTLKDGNPEELLKHAQLVLHLSGNPMPCEPVWMIRALACGTPVAGWRSPACAQFFQRPELGFFADEGDWASLMNGIKNILPRHAAANARRAHALGLFGQRSQAARYRDIYKSLLVPA